MLEGELLMDQSMHVDPSYENFEPILCLTKSTKYGSLSPYELFDEHGCNMENIWQSHKIYETIPESTQRYSRYDSTVIWKYPKQQHMKNGEILPEYWNWRQELMHNKYAVRYPVGYNWRHKCVGTVIGTPEDYEIVDYITARKRVYLPIYVDLVKSKPQFQQLKQMIANGKNLLIIEVDGPHQESMDYYKSKYGVADDFIVGNTILATPENMEIMLNDPKHPFGHGYCLALALMNTEL